RSGGYGVVHSHVDHFSGAVLLAAQLAGVPNRIAHIREGQYVAPDGRWRTLYRHTMQALIDAAATTVIGEAESAMDAFWGSTWRRDPRKLVIYNGVDPVRVEQDASAPTVREEFAVPPDARLVLHIGGFEAAKDHAALIRIADALLSRRDDIVLLLVGDSPART